MENRITEELEELVNESVKLIFEARKLLELELDNETNELVQYKRQRVDDLLSDVQTILRVPATTITECNAKLEGLGKLGALRAQIDLFLEEYEERKMAVDVNN